MTTKRRRAAISAMVLALSTGVAGSVLAATQSSDEAALRPTRQAADGGVEKRVDRLLRRMTLDEKLQQIQLLSDGQITDADATKGVGSVFSLVDPVKINALQKIAVEKSRRDGAPVRSGQHGGRGVVGISFRFRLGQVRRATVAQAWALIIAAVGANLAVTQSAIPGWLVAPAAITGAGLLLGGAHVAAPVARAISSSA